jgi:hypothetical protein
VAEGGELVGVTFDDGRGGHIYISRSIDMKSQAPGAAEQVHVHDREDRRTRSLPK